MHYMNIVSYLEETIPVNIFLFKVRNKNTRKRCESYSELTAKTLERRLTLIFFLVDFEQVNVCWDVIKRLFNDCWSILKMLCIQCCSHPSNFYWHNSLMYNSFLNKNAGDVNTRNTTK